MQQLRLVDFEAEDAEEHSERERWARLLCTPEGRAQFLQERQRDYPVRHDTAIGSEQDMSPLILRAILPTLACVRVPSPDGTVTWLFKTQADREAMLLLALPALGCA